VALSGAEGRGSAPPRRHDASNGSTGVLTDSAGEQRRSASECMEPAHSSSNARNTQDRKEQQGPDGKAVARGREVVPPERSTTVFVGTFEHTLDGKGRVVLPSTFRNELAGKGYLTQYENCLGIWTEQGFTEVASRLNEKKHEGKTTNNAIRAFAANAVQIEPDTQGRILIPQRLRDFAALDREVVIIGAIDRIEIWKLERWQSVSAEADASLLGAVTDLGI